MEARICKKGEMRIDGRCIHATTWAIKNLEKLDPFDEVYDKIMQHDPKPSWHEEMVFYKEIWVHPKIREWNKKSGIMRTGFCHLYENKYDKKYLFVLGRMGNTVNLIFGSE